MSSSRQASWRAPTDCPGNGRLVLLVDDDPGELRLWAGICAPRIHIRTANGASEALEATRQQRPDAIISDVRMTELDGFMLCSVFHLTPHWAPSRSCW